MTAREGITLDPLLFDAFFVCVFRTLLGAPIQGDVRLSGSRANESAGAVEIYRGSSTGWVTVCDDFWDRTDASVACMQLGYESGVATSFNPRNL